MIRNRYVRCPSCRQAWKHLPEPIQYYGDRVSVQCRHCEHVFTVDYVVDVRYSSPAMNTPGPDARD